MGKLDWLVHDLELVAGECLFEFRRQRRPFARGGAHLVVEQFAATAAALFRPVHRRVGRVEQRDGRVGRAHLREEVVRGHRDTDARTGLDLDAVQHERSGDGGADAFRDVECDVVVENPLAEHHELVAGDACDGVVRSRGVRESLRDGDDQLVTDCVADRVVDVLQLVEVDEEHRHLHARGARSLERLGGLADEEHTVRQSGERIVRCNAVEFRPCLALLRDVACDGRPVVHRSVGFTHHLCDDRERAGESLGRTERNLTLPAVRVRRAGVQHEPRQLVAHGLHVRARGDVVGDRLGGVHADHGACGVVREREVADAVEHDHRVTGHIEQADELVRQ